MSILNYITQDSNIYIFLIKIIARLPIEIFFIYII